MVECPVGPDAEVVEDGGLEKRLRELLDRKEPGDEGQDAADVVPVRRRVEPESFPETV